MIGLTASRTESPGPLPFMQGVPDNPVSHRPKCNGGSVDLKLWAPDVSYIGESHLTPRIPDGRLTRSRRHRCNPAMCRRHRLPQ